MKCFDGKLRTGLHWLQVAWLAAMLCPLPCRAQTAIDKKSSTSEPPPVSTQEQQLGFGLDLTKSTPQSVVFVGAASQIQLNVKLCSVDSGRGQYKEVSSASNAHTFQARRGNIRFRRKETGKNEFIHTLNASGLATSRLVPALVEQLQQSDGSVLVPEVLKERVGKDVLR